MITIDGKQIKLQIWDTVSWNSFKLVDSTKWYPLTKANLKFFKNTEIINT